MPAKSDQKPQGVRSPLRPLLKWPGGKRSEIPFLKSAYPKDIKRVVEPFSGGAAVSFELNPDHIVLNDLSKGLVEFYRTMKDDSARKATLVCLVVLDRARKKIKESVAELSQKDLDDVFSNPDTWVLSKCHDWLNGMPKELELRTQKDLIAQAKQKTVDRIPKLEKKMGIVFDEEFRRKHLETGLQAGVYTTMRRIFNSEAPELGPVWSNAAWWFVRSLCYSGMFRYSKSGNYNVPYGGIGYNSRDFETSIEQLSSSEMVDFFKRTDVNELDFETLFAKYNHFGTGDFIFVDPPYDSAFSQYNPEMDFARVDQERLAATLKKTKAPWMLVIKNTPFILALYQGKGLHRGVFGKTYQANFRNRHEREAEHLVVTNYPFTFAKEGEIGIYPEQ